MGTIITFPQSRRDCGVDAVRNNEPATIIILPVIRIERYVDKPSGKILNRPPAPSRKRRRRSSRS